MGEIEKFLTALKTRAKTDNQFINRHRYIAIGKTTTRKDLDKIIADTEKYCKQYAAGLKLITECMDKISEDKKGEFIKTLQTLLEDNQNGLLSKKQLTNGLTAFLDSSATQPKWMMHKRV